MFVIPKVPQDLISSTYNIKPPHIRPFVKKEHNIKTFDIIKRKSKPITTYDFDIKRVHLKKEFRVKTFKRADADNSFNEKKILGLPEVSKKTEKTNNINKGFYEQKLENFVNHEANPKNTNEFIVKNLQKEAKAEVGVRDDEKDKAFSEFLASLPEKRKSKKTGDDARPLDDVVRSADERKTKKEEDESRPLDDVLGSAEKKKEKKTKSLIVEPAFSDDGRTDKETIASKPATKKDKDDEDNEDEDEDEDKKEEEIDIEEVKLRFEKWKQNKTKKGIDSIVRNIGHSKSYTEEQKNELYVYIFGKIGDEYFKASISKQKKYVLKDICNSLGIEYEEAEENKTLEDKIFKYVSDKIRVKGPTQKTLKTVKL